MTSFRELYETSPNIFLQHSSVFIVLQTNTMTCWEISDLNVLEPWED